MNILLCCGLGMSTSLLVSKMKKFAEVQELECHIWAIPVDVVEQHIHQADVLLVAPQVRYMLHEFLKLGEKNRIPVRVIDTLHYGIFNGAEVLKLAQEAYLDHSK